MHKTLSHQGQKETRLSVRISAADKAVIARAARLDRSTISDFVVNQALQASKRLLDEETQLLMTPAQFKQFCRVLDTPPAKNLKALQKLLREPSVFDG